MAEAINMNNENIGTTEDNKKIPVADFIKKYTGLTSDKTKEMYLKSVVAEDGFYVPYYVKAVYADSIVKAANLTEDGIYYNSPKEYQCYVATLLAVYTNLDIPDEGFPVIFDDLNKEGLVEVLLTAMPADKAEFDTVLEMIKHDFDMNHDNRIVQSVKDGILIGINGVIDGILNTLKSEEFADMLTQFTEKNNTGNE